MFTVTVKEINQYLSLPDLLDLLAIEELLLEEIRDFVDVFSPREADKLPPHCLYDHNIRLLGGKAPLFGPLYPMS